MSREARLLLSRALDSVQYARRFREDTTGKLEYDLYRVKHISFWLDMSIVFRTVRIILTGFGARQLWGLTTSPLGVTRLLETAASLFHFGHII